MSDSELMDGDFEWRRPNIRWYQRLVLGILRGFGARYRIIEIGGVIVGVKTHCSAPDRVMVTLLTRHNVAQVEISKVLTIANQARAFRMSEGIARLREIGEDALSAGIIENFNQRECSTDVRKLWEEHFQKSWGCSINA